MILVIVIINLSKENFNKLNCKNKNRKFSKKLKKSKNKQSIKPCYVCCCCHVEDG